MINFVTYTFTPVVIEIGKGLQISVEKLAQQIEWSFYFSYFFLYISISKPIQDILRMLNSHCNIFESLPVPFYNESYPY